MLAPCGEAAYVAGRESPPAHTTRREGRSVPTETIRLGATLIVACASATLFLFLRCEGKGRAFGPSSWRWAVLVIAATGVLSTAAAVGCVYVLGSLPPLFFGVGVVAPSWLWLGEIRKRGDDRRNLVRDMSTLWLTRLLARLHEGMAEDRLTWCEARVDPMWSMEELSTAARFYHGYLRERLSPDERRRGRIHALLAAIEARLNVAQLIHSGAGRAKVVSALQGARITREPRYSRNLDDLSRLADILRHDAQRDLVRLLGTAYTAGYHKMSAHHPGRLLADG
jgi:hypothetical protein